MSNANEAWLEFVKSTKAFVTVPASEWEQMRTNLENARENYLRADREALALKLALLPEVAGDWQHEIDRAMRKGLAIAFEKCIHPPGSGLHGPADWGHLKRLIPGARP